MEWLTPQPVLNAIGPQKATLPLNSQNNTLGISAGISCPCSIDKFFLPKSSPCEEKVPA
jgi:hypothetical protein